MSLLLRATERPILRKLDQHIECYGAKPYKNLFRRFPFDEDAYVEEIKIIKQAIDAYKHKETHVAIFYLSWPCVEFIIYRW